MTETILIMKEQLSGVLMSFAFFDRTRNQQFDELAQIFSDDDNQRMCREILYRVSVLYASILVPAVNF